MTTRRTRPRRQRYVVCVSNRGYPASLERCKLYRCEADATAARTGYLRVVDESGESYLYPSKFFEPVALSPEALRRLRSRPR